MITLDLLKNHKKSLPSIVTLWHNLLGKVWMPHLPIKYIETLVSSWIHNDKMPLAHCAFKDEVVVGCASLQENCGIRSDLTPWLGSLVVHADYQKQGIGKALIDMTKNKAKELQYNILYLFTFDPYLVNYYTKIGWAIVGTDIFQYRPVTIMKIDI